MQTLYFHRSPCYKRRSIPTKIFLVHSCNKNTFLNPSDIIVAHFSPASDLLKKSSLISNVIPFHAHLDVLLGLDGLFPDILHNG
jgi:hypothetical protein